MNDENAKALTAAILTLNANIENLTAALYVGEQVVAQEQAAEALVPTVEQPEKEAEPTVTRDSLQAACMGLVRADRANKAKIVALLDDYGVKTLTALADAHLVEFGEKLGAI